MADRRTLLSGVCHRNERIVHRSLTDVSRFGAEAAAATFVGESASDFDKHSANFPPSIYTTFWHKVAADRVLTVSDTSSRIEPIIAQAPRYCRRLSATSNRGVLSIRQHFEVNTMEGIERRGENEIRVATPPRLQAMAAR